MAGRLPVQQQRYGHILASQTGGNEGKHQCHPHIATLHLNASMKLTSRSTNVLLGLLFLAGVGIAVWNAVSTASLLSIKAAPVSTVGTVTSCTDMRLRVGGFIQTCEVNYTAGTVKYSIAVNAKPGVNLGNGSKVPIYYQAGHPRNAATATEIQNVVPDSKGMYFIAAFICLLSGATALLTKLRAARMERYISSLRSH